MDLRGLVLLPVRVTVAATQATLGLGQLASPNGPILREGGYGTRLGQMIGEGGLLDQVGRILADERGPIGLANTLADLTADDRPIGKALARDGLLDRMADEDGPIVRLLEAGGSLDRALSEDGPLYRFLAPGGALDKLLAENGALDRLLADGGALDTLLAENGALDRLLAENGAIERVLAEGGLLEQLVADDGIVERLLAPGGTLEQLVALGATFDAIAPRLELLGDALPELNAAVGALSGAVEPLSHLAGRLPGGRRRPATDTVRAIARDVE